MLVDASCVSSCESTLEYLREHPKAKVFGERTRHLLPFDDSSAREDRVLARIDVHTARDRPKDALATATREHQKRLTNYRRLFGEEDLVTRAGEENVIGWRWGDEAMLTLHVGRATPEGAIEVTSLWLDARCAAE